jgi:hypothetical protein
MVFKRKFFLDLSGDDAKKPVEVAPVKPVTEKPAQGQAEGAGKGKAAVAPEPAATTAPAPATATASAASGAGPVLTTAEAIAAELAAAQANRPAPSKATFAPDCLAPSGGLPRPRRLAGANLGVFKEMAKGMMRS